MILSRRGHIGLTQTFLPGKPRPEEHQNEYGRAKTKDLFSWDN
jgi:hypothetical protein